MLIEVDFLATGDYEAEQHCQRNQFPFDRQL